MTTVTIEGKEYEVTRDPIKIAREFQHEGKLQRNAVELGELDPTQSDEDLHLVLAVKPLLDCWEEMVMAGEIQP